MIIKPKPQALRETFLKGRMAESLVHDLLHEAGHRVFRIGYETVLPGLTEKERIEMLHTSIGERMRTIPDFFAIDNKGNPHLVEVKFRWKPDGHENDPKLLARLYTQWEEAIVVFVNCTERPYFRISLPPYVDKKGMLSAQSIDEFPAFHIPDTLVEKFEELVEKYLKPTLTTPLPKDSSFLRHKAQFFD